MHKYLISMRADNAGDVVLACVLWLPLCHIKQEVIDERVRTISVECSEDLAEYLNDWYRFTQGSVDLGTLLTYSNVSATMH